MKKLRNKVKKVMGALILLNGITIAHPFLYPEIYETNCGTFVGYENVESWKSKLIFEETMKDHYGSPRNNIWRDSKNFAFLKGRKYQLMVESGLSRDKVLYSDRCSSEVN
jgi:hypothetical protein